MGQMNTYVLLPMSFLCGTFFSPHALPDAVRWAVEVLPLTHASYLLRGLGSGAEVSLLSAAVLALYLVAGFWLGGRAFVHLRQ